MSFKVRFAHKSHLDNLFIVSCGHVFQLGASAKAVFRREINGLIRVLDHEKYVTIGGMFNSIEEVFQYIEKEFPGHIPSHPLIHRMARTRWVAPEAQSKVA